MRSCNRVVSQVIDTSVYQYTMRSNSSRPSESGVKTAVFGFAFLHVWFVVLLSHGSFSNIALRTPVAHRLGSKHFREIHHEAPSNSAFNCISGS